MTGFARVNRSIAEGEIVFSVKSVNHRGLDLHFHLSPELDPIENDLRGVMRAGIARGHVQVHVSFVRSAAAGAAIFNRELLDAYIRAFREASELYQLKGQPDLNSALRLPGMLAAPADDGLAEPIFPAVLELAAQGVAALNEFREREGAVTATELRQRCQAIYAGLDRMLEIRNSAVPAFQKRLRERLSELLHTSGLDAQRLAQEAAIMADRSDINEELARLRTHTEQLESMLIAGGEVGKRLDFLLQEMNRESNTMLSKTGGLGDLGLTITELALAAKSDIDKIREQALNLE